MAILNLDPKTNNELFQLLWNEERADRIVHYNWPNVFEKSKIFSPHINKAIKALSNSQSNNERKSYIKDLSQELCDLILIQLTRQMIKRPEANNMRLN